MKIKANKKPNLVDIFILIALLAIVGAAVLGVVRGIRDGGEKVTLKYVIEVSPIDSAFAAKVAANDKVLEYKTGSPIGSVSAVSSSQAYHKGTDSQGAVVSSPMEGYSTLYITATAEAKRTDTGYSVGSTTIGVGRELTLRLKNLYCTGKCVSIEVVE